MWRRWAVTVAGAAVVVAAGSSPVGASPGTMTTAGFPDVPPGSQFAADIDLLVHNGITGGYADGTFQPASPVTRQAMAAFLYRFDHGGADAADCTSAAFPDVPPTAQFCGAISWLVDAGITGGYADGTFQPAAPISRQAMAAFLHRYADRGASAVGADVSHPQCGGPLPVGQAFGVVGVNGGTATTTNPCLATQLAWAEDSAGWTGQDRVQLYVNTANPGGLGTPSWPTSGTNRYGTCTGGNDRACAYQYGRERAEADATVRGVPRPLDHVWWLDVETTNTWPTESEQPGALARNVAVLEGMVEYLTGIGVREVGLYSTGLQWNEIVGDAVGPTSSLNGLPSWLAGASSSADARARCSWPPLTDGGTVRMTQYIDTFDRNVDCH